ncbi:MAG: tyrosine-protein phosphatase [Pseudomonadota bacterium]
MPLIPDDVHIWREPDGDYHLRWRTSHPESLVAVEALADAAHQTELVEAGARVSGLPEGKRHFFRVSDQYGNSVTAPERRIALDGSPNFRDFGGYKTTDDRTLRWGYLFRSGQLSRLTSRDVDTLAGLGLDLVCDFRREDEQQIEPSRLPGERTPRVVSLPIVPGSNSAFFEQGERELHGRETMVAFMEEVNRDFVEGQAETYARMFEEILATDEARFLVHCAAGKDRTGFAAALVLLALGVSEQLIMQDYMLTGQFYSPEREVARLREKYGLEDMAAEAILPMLEVHRGYLQRALDTINQQYGDTRTYLSEVLHVGESEREELRRRYLVDDS